MKMFRGLTGVSAAALLIGGGLVYPGSARADQVIPDDLIVQGSTCVGTDCVDGEDFGISTLRLKENNTRLHFMDTSTTAGFAANKWSIVANDSVSGGANFLAFEDQGPLGDPDVQAFVQSFKVMAGARANALVVGSNNNVGIGVASPALLMHMNRNDTPAIRLEQDNTGGFTAQTWDIGANEANFFVRDLTGGSRLPFRIRPGAPTSSLDIAASGFVGIGTNSPQTNLHVVAAATPTIQLESRAGPKWTVAAAGGFFVIRDGVNNKAPIRVTPGAPTNSILVRDNGGLQLAGHPGCTNGLRTNAQGVVSCMPAGNKDSAAGDSGANGAGGIKVAAYNTANTAGAAGGGDAGSSRTGATETREAPAGCSEGDIAGSWSMFGTNIEEGSANSVLWCDVQFSSNGKAPAKYSIDGVCRNHATHAALPQNYLVSGDRSITVTQACKFSGNFSIKQGRTSVTATILEGRIEGESGSKTRAVGVSRWPRGKTFALQTFTMQR